MHPLDLLISSIIRYPTFNYQINIPQNIYLKITMIKALLNLLESNTLRLVANHVIIVIVNYSV